MGEGGPSKLVGGGIIITDLKEHLPAELGEFPHPKQILYIPGPTMARDRSLVSKLRAASIGAYFLAYIPMVMITPYPMTYRVNNVTSFELAIYGFSNS